MFDEEAITGKLLILGAPGAGKTTTLLQLAQELVKRAETDTRKPMPVLLNLSSWKDDSQTIASSLVDGMHVKYGIRKDISQRWLDERSLLTLGIEIDGKKSHSKGLTLWFASMPVHFLFPSTRFFSGLLKTPTRAGCGWAQKAD